MKKWQSLLLALAASSGTFRVDAMEFYSTQNFYHAPCGDEDTNCEEGESFAPLHRAPAPSAPPASYLGAAPYYDTPAGASESGKSYDEEGDDEVAVWRGGKIHVDKAQKQIVNEGGFGLSIGLPRAFEIVWTKFSRIADPTFSFIYAKSERPSRHVLRIFNLTTKASFDYLSESEINTIRLASQNEDALVVAKSNRRYLNLINCGSRLLYEYKSPSTIEELAVSPKGKYVAIVMSNLILLFNEKLEQLGCFDPKYFPELKAIMQQGAIAKLAFTKDRSLLVTGQYGLTAKLALKDRGEPYHFAEPVEFDPLPHPRTLSGDSVGLVSVAFMQVFRATLMQSLEGVFTSSQYSAFITHLSSKEINIPLFLHDLSDGLERFSKQKNLRPEFKKMINNFLKEFFESEPEDRWQVTNRYNAASYHTTADQVSEKDFFNMLVQFIRKLENDLTI